MQVPFNDLKRQLAPLREEIELAMKEVIDNTAFIGGSFVKQFEKTFAEAHQARHCIGVGNGTDAIVLTLKALGIGDGDKVIVPANSFIASSEAVTEAGARVQFIDVDERTFHLNPEKVENALDSDSTIKAILPVHLYGRSFDLERLKTWREKYGVKIVEDAAQAHLSQYGTNSLAEWTDAATFSFYPGKNLGAFGDAGAVITNDTELAEKIRMWANHGRMDKYNHQFEGCNSRLDNLQAAVLQVKMQHLKEWSHLRYQRAVRYNEQLAGTGLTLPELPPFPGHVLHLYVIRHPDRDHLQQHLNDEGIKTGIHYPIALPNLEAYKYLGHTPEDFPVASRLQNEILSLPLFAEMTDDEQDCVIATIKSW